MTKNTISAKLKLRNSQSNFVEFKIVEIDSEKKTLFQIYFCGNFSHTPNNWKLQNYIREKILNP